MGKGETDHSITLTIGAADLAIFRGKKIMLTRDFGHYCKWVCMINHHWKIMSYNVVNRMT